MQPTQTGIATALALVVVVFFFIFNGMSIFSQPQDLGAAAVEQTSALQTAATATTMSTDTTSATQLQVTDGVVGTGTAAAVGDSVTVHYVGALTNGTVFDASASHPETVNGFTFILGAGQVIKGWDEGIVGMKEGGKRKLVIPASLAYGDQAIGNIIPAGSTLVFEVELLKVQK